LREIHHRVKNNLQLISGLLDLSAHHTNGADPVALLEDARSRIYTMGLVHHVFPDETFEQEVWDFCRHLAKQNGEQMGAAKVAIEMAHEVGRDHRRHVERMANSALMLNPDYLAGIAEYLKGVGGKR
jgi:two-component sensor histidine kinase